MADKVRKLKGFVAALLPFYLVPLFSSLLVGVIVIVGALTFFPALSLGPVLEHFLMNNGQVF